jgi:hypothetical protein
MRFCAGVIVLLSACWPIESQPPAHAAEVPSMRAGGDRLTYNVEWRSIHAGTVVIEAQKTEATLRLESEGIVSSLVKIHDLYHVDYDDAFCASSAVMDSQEGKRHHETKVTYDRAAGRASYLERDLLKNAVLHADQVAIPNCVQEVVGAFLKLRQMDIGPGQTAQIPMSDGRKSAAVKIEAQEREEVKTALGTYKTIRLEANMLNGVVYTRKGRVFVWLTDDSRRLPVQIRLRMQFPIGTVSLQLAKEDHP